MGCSRKVGRDPSPLDTQKIHMSTLCFCRQGEDPIKMVALEGGGTVMEAEVAAQEAIDWAKGRSCGIGTDNTECKAALP